VFTADSERLSFQPVKPEAAGPISKKDHSRLRRTEKKQLEESLRLLSVEMKRLVDHSPSSVDFQNNHYRQFAYSGRNDDAATGREARTMVVRRHWSMGALSRKKWPK
jgi:hypothetical protein